MNYLKSFILYTIIFMAMNVNTEQVQGQNIEDIKSHIVLLERSALEMWNNGNPDGYLDLYSDDVTYFDPYFETKLEGITKLRAYYDEVRGQINVRKYEMINPVVQMLSDAAVLSYNLISYIDTGESKWNCTEVYKKEGELWKIAHVHWSYVKPLEDKSED